MTDLASEHEDLREEAARWFARMRRPDANQFRAEFDQWLAEPEHLATYNRIAARFSDAKILRQASPVGCGSKQASPTAIQLAAILATALLGAIVVLASIETWRPGTVAIPGSAAADGNLVGAKLALETSRGEIRKMRLADGSIVTLDAESLLTVSFTSATRQLRLERGRARVAVAWDSRRFELVTSNAAVVTRDAMFDVSIASDAVVGVAVIDGEADVSANTALNAGAVLRLTAASAAIVDDRAIAASSTRLVQADWPSGIAEYDGVPLGRVIAEAQRYGASRIRLADPRLAALRVSGRFRVDRPEALADNIAHILGLKVDRSIAGELTLRSP